MKHFTSTINTTTLLFFCLFFLISIPACKDDPEVITLDKELRSALQNVSTTGDLSFFQFPSSEDLNSIPQDPKNPLTQEKVALGQLLFHETGLAVKPKNMDGLLSYSCASCHHAAAGFQACKPQGFGEGGEGFGARGEGRNPSSSYLENEVDVQPIRTPSAMNGAFQSVTLWNGQFGAGELNNGTEANWTPGTPKETNLLGYLGLEIQAIAGLGVHRLDVNKALIDSLGYLAMFDAVFSNFPETERYTLETAGLSIAAFERTMMANEAPFQKWLGGDDNAMTEQEKDGALVFFTKANCSSCHTGPALSTDAFHAIGLNDLVGNHILQSNPEDGAHLGRGGFTNNTEELFRFKVPQLYNMKDSPFYGHGSSITTLREVVRYKNNAIKQNTKVPQNALDPLFVPQGLTDVDIDNLVAFLENALHDPNLQRYQPESVLSGNCIPNNDAVSQHDLGCN